MRKIDKIILHCSATIEGKNFTINDIDEWHKNRGYKKIGYHFVIHIDGSLHIGRDINEVGAHCQGHNSTSIGICYIGGLDNNNNPKDTRTNAQKNTMKRLVEELLIKYNLTSKDVYGHYQFANKACPSFKIEDF